MYYAVDRAKTIREELKRRSILKTIPLDSWQLKEGFYLTPEEAHGAAAPFVPFSCGKDLWGGPDKHAWFHTRTMLPNSEPGTFLSLHLSSGHGTWDAIHAQMLVFLNGGVIQGSDLNHTDIFLTNQTGKVEIDVQCYSGRSTEPQLFFAELRVLDQKVWELYHDFKLAIEVAEVVSKDDFQRAQLDSILTETVNLLDLRVPGSSAYERSIESAHRSLTQALFTKDRSIPGAVCSCIGHTHIDIAWWWTVAQTREKAVRSFATVLKLMEEYPQYKFMSSQPVLYEMVKERYPELFEKIRARVREGRWEAEGGMWVEADCNLASGESLVRQFIYGKRFFREEFGKENEVLWLPDVFGYCASLPQICKKCGIRYFMTTKITWNQMNKMPYDTFFWQGIDGTKLFTYFITTREHDMPEEKFMTTYNGILNASSVRGTWNRYQQKNINQNVLMAFGYGDGGGGATRDMLENAKRLYNGVIGMPQVEQKFVKDYFEALYEDAAENPELPVWSGELYLEYHRGTYTSMARNKRSNRKCEFLLTDAEFFSLWAMRTGEEYPKEFFDRSWKTVLTNQFHDILPGSSIREVYEVTKQEYEQVENDTNALILQKLSSLAGLLPGGEGIALFHSLSKPRFGLTELPSSLVQGKNLLYHGEIVPMQKTADGNYLVRVSVPGRGACVLEFGGAEKKEISNPFVIGEDYIETEYYKITLNHMGQFCSYFDKTANREVLKEGECANVLRVFEDKPIYYDNWDIDIFYTQKSWIVEDVQKMEWLERGPLRAVLLVEYRFLTCLIRQKIIFYSHTKQVDFNCEVDWKMSQHLLKVFFPVDVNTNQARYDIQFGNVERPTHRNTSWDVARFEVCAHKWADVSETGYGAALMNDCKYGYGIEGSTIGLTLIKAGIEPNPTADLEKHFFTYSFLPHEGGFAQSHVEDASYELNVPVYAVAKSKRVSQEMELCPQYLNVTSDNAILETVKRAEESNAAVIRFFEYKNQRGTVRITLPDHVQEVWEINLTEDEMAASYLVSDGEFSFEIKPYEIRTFLLK